MNILIPHKWLLEHLDTKATPRKIREIVSLSGPSIERIYNKEGDSVYDIEVTTNRVDSMSIRGIAREAAVILSQAGIPASLKPLNISVEKNIKPNTDEFSLPKINNDPSINKRTLCVILKNVKRTPTPQWMAEKLKQVDIGIHDSVIDITNYVTHDLGHPCHAFDYDKLMNTGGEINILEAKKGEKFTTLDGLDFTTVGGEVVFKNGEGAIIDLPSIKGTANTSIDDSTKHVLLLIESIDAHKVRFASMTHAIRTTAAQLMEKNVDPNLGEIVLRKGIELYTNLCGASIGSPIYDDFPGKTNPKSVEVPLSKISDYLGLELDNKTIVKILEDLECKVALEENSITVTPPTFRPDMTIPADIIEEISRIYGYHNLPSVVMPTQIPLIRPTHTDFTMEDKIKHYLANIGWQEIYTYSMVSEKIALESGYSLDKHLKLANPLTEDRVYMRRSLLPSLKEIILQNPQRKKLSVFELAKVYIPQKNNIPNEQMFLSLVSTKNYLQAKGDLESLLEQFYLTDIVFQQNDSNTSAKISIIENSNKQTAIGTIQVQDGFTMVDIVFEKLLEVAKNHPTYQPLPTTSSIVESLTFTLLPKTQIGKIITAIKNLDKLIKNVELDSIYKNNASFKIEYWDSKNNLSNEDIAPLRKSVANHIENEFKAKLVGQL